MNVYDVGIMTLRGVSSSIYNIYFIFSIFAGYLIMVRFSQVNIYAKSKMKEPKDLMVEFIVQGIVMGVLLSFVVTFVGIPLVYTEYLYFILPMSFVLGYYHVKYTNITYSALVLSLLSLIFRGQTIATRTLPNIEVTMSGLLSIVGILLVSEGVLLVLLRSKDMVPIVAKKDGHIVIGFAMQRFWPIPVAILVATGATSSGDIIPMPQWWPLFGHSTFTSIGYAMFLLPLVFIVCHGSISFTKSPVQQQLDNARRFIVSGLLMLGGAWLTDRIQGVEFLGMVLMFISSFVLDWYIERKEDRGIIAFPKGERGVRVLYVELSSLAKTLGFEAGDKIKVINGIEITTLYQMQAILKDWHNNFHVSVEKASGVLVEVSFTKQVMKSNGLGLVYLPDRPQKICEYDEVKGMGMMHMLNTHRFR